MTERKIKKQKMMSDYLGGFVYSGLCFTWFYLVQRRSIYCLTP